MTQNIKDFIEEGEKEFEKEWNRVMRGTGTGYGSQQVWLKDFISSRQISLIKMIVEMVEKIEVDRCYSCDNAIRDIILSELQPPEIVCARCNGIATIGEYNDGFRDYLCKNCDITFLNDNKQTIIS